VGSGEGPVDLKLCIDEERRENAAIRENGDVERETREKRVKVFFKPSAHFKGEKLGSDSFVTWETVWARLHTSG
jgi:hypothetical protein